MIMPPRPAALALAILAIAVGSAETARGYPNLLATKRDCEYYFGELGNSTYPVTIVDPDVTAGFPYGKRTFIHYSGPASKCIPPGPPKGCHRYFVATYTECGDQCMLTDASASSSLSGKLDVTGLFDRGTGALRACEACLHSVRIVCWGAPADHPVSCRCPGA